MIRLIIVLVLCIACMNIQTIFAKHAGEQGLSHAKRLKGSAAVKSNPSHSIAKAEDTVVKFRIDATKVPEKKDWAENKLKSELEKRAKLVIELLDGKGSLWTRGDVTLIIHPNDGVASASAQIRTIWLSSKFAEKFPHEVIGACIHEFTHIVQDYCPAPGRAVPYASVPGWLVEGIADWVRWVNYEGESGLKHITEEAKSSPRHDAGYKTTASFLDYVSKQYDSEFVMKLNKICRQGKYTEEVWATLTKKTRAQLADEWKLKLNNE